jgi:membrane-bound serine protease (ClpP class)
MLTLAALILCRPAALAPPVQGDAGGEGAPSAGATVLRIEGELDIAHQALLVRGISGAKERGDKLVVELDTPGGEVQLAWRMARLLDEASKDGVRTVAWVNDHALSAGALLALACDDIYMRGTASFGAAQAIALGPGGIEGVPADEVVEEKYDSTWRASFRAFAEEHHRSPDLAEAMVDEDVEVRLVHVDGAERIVGEQEWDDLRERGEEVHLDETISDDQNLLNLTCAEAVRFQMASGRADRLEEVLASAGLAGAPVTQLEVSRSEELASLLNTLGPVLLILGLVLAFVELKAPGFGVPGILSACCFAALLLGRYLVGLAEIAHVLLIAAGVVLLAVELFLVPGTIWVGLLGAALIFVGFVWSGLSSGAGFEYEMDRSIALDSAFRAAMSAFVALVLALLLSRVLPKTPLYAHLAVAPADPRAARGSALPESEGAHAAAARTGAVGVALTDLRPVGKVALDAARELEFEARSSGPEIGRGTRVVVVEAASGRLVVEVLHAAGAGQKA